MLDQKNKIERKKVDTKEFDLPETHFVSDIDNKVFQGIVLECLANMDGISLSEGNLLDSLLGRANVERVKGIFIEQNCNNNTVGVKLEVNIKYGLPIPEMAEEIQTKITEDITKFTGLHVSSVHVVFKNLIPREQSLQNISPAVSQGDGSVDDEYNDEF